MAQPTAYNRQVSFQDYQAASPSAPMSGTSLDSEFNQVKITLDEILNNLALLQRDDGELANEAVGNDQLAPSLAIGFNSPTQWLTGTNYVADVDTIFNANKFYVCRTTHTSGTFATDLAAVKWELLADLSTSNTIDDGSLANAKLADMAASTIKGRRVSEGVPEDLTVAQVRALLEIGDGAVTDNALARWDSTLGALQNSVVTVADTTGNMANVGTLSMSGTITIAGTATAAGKIVLGEDTDNGAHTATLTPPQSIAADYTVTLPAVTATLATLGANTFTGAQSFADNTLSRPKLIDYGETVNIIGAIGGGTQDIDLELGNVVSATVDTSETTFTFSNPPATGVEGGFKLYLTNGGSQTVNWPASVDWAGGTAPVLTASGVDILVFTTIDEGTIWYGFAAGVAMASP
jgi:hypothetical protein